MHYSRAFIPTVKEVPRDATMPSHILLLRGGYIRLVGAGIYELLPLGLRVLNKIAAIVREEMDRAGAHELLMPALLPAEYFKETGRWESFGDNLLRLKDRKGADCHLGPTHEEIITDLARREVRSYRQLPLNLYQIQTKFRDEPRPRAGLLRCREFVMKDAYSFDADDASALLSYEKMRECYHRIFRRLGLKYRVVEADSGAMGGSSSAEFQVLAATGEDNIVACSKCQYAANLEVAAAAQQPAGDAIAEPPGRPEKVATPGKRTIDEVVAFLGEGLTPANMLKSLIYQGGGRTVMTVVRGDHEVNEVKLARYLGVDEVFLADDAEVQRVTGAPVGFAGPVGFEGEMVADLAVGQVTNGVTGANEKDAHLRNVRHGRDFQAPLCDLRNVNEGDPCIRCGSPLELYRGIEAGHIFVLGTHYSAKMGADFLDEKGEKKPLVMGCYGIGVSRLLAAVIEQNHDDNGICWPASIAPFQVIITRLDAAGRIAEVAADLYEQLTSRGVQVLLDDRDERPGVKFKDADLLGIPLRITVGARGLEKGGIEIKRRSGSAGAELVPVDSCLQTVLGMLEAGKAEPARAAG